MMYEILGGFAALAALMVGLIAWLRADMHREIAGLRAEMGELRERMARMEGMFEVLSRAIGLPRPEAAK